MSIIELKGINKIYNPKSEEEVHALKDIDLVINKGEMVAIMGPSGSGKSTLLHILGCLDNPTDGDYLLDGAKVNQSKNKDLAKIRNKRIGFVLQDFGILNDRTALENVIVPLLFDRSVKWSSVDKKALDIMEKLEINGLAKRRPHQLSGGQKQRVAIARALVNNPDIILADEPTGALDSRLTEEIFALLKKLNEEGKTVIVVTHNPVISNYCQRTLKIIDGKITKGL